MDLADPALWFARKVLPKSSNALANFVQPLQEERWLGDEIQIKDIREVIFMLRAYLLDVLHEGRQLTESVHISFDEITSIIGSIDRGQRPAFGTGTRVRMQVSNERLRGKLGTVVNIDSRRDEIDLTTRRPVCFDDETVPGDRIKSIPIDKLEHLDNQFFHGTRVRVLVENPAFNNRTGTCFATSEDMCRRARRVVVFDDTNLGQKAISIHKMVPQNCRFPLGTRVRVRVSNPRYNQRIGVVADPVPPMREKLTGGVKIITAPSRRAIRFDERSLGTKSIAAANLDRVDWAQGDGPDYYKNRYHQYFGAEHYILYECVAMLYRCHDHVARHLSDLKFLAALQRRIHTQLRCFTKKPANGSVQRRPFDFGCGMFTLCSAQDMYVRAYIDALKKRLPYSVATITSLRKTWDTTCKEQRTFIIKAMRYANENLSFGAGEVMKQLPVFTMFRDGPLDIVFNAVCNYMELFELLNDEQKVNEHAVELVPFFVDFAPTLFTKYLKKYPIEPVRRPVSLEVATKLRCIRVLSRQEMLMAMYLSRSQDTEYGDVSELPHNMEIFLIVAKMAKVEHLFKVSWNALCTVTSMLIGFGDIEEFGEYESCIIAVDAILTLFFRMSKRNWSAQAEDFGALVGPGEIDDHFTLLEKSELIGTLKDGETDYGSVGSRVSLVEKVASTLRSVVRKELMNYEVWKSAMEYHAKKSAASFKVAFRFWDETGPTAPNVVASTALAEGLYLICALPGFEKIRASIIADTKKRNNGGGFVFRALTEKRAKAAEKKDIAASNEKTAKAPKPKAKKKKKLHACTRPECDKTESTPREFQRCGRCSHRYCSAECSKGDWSRHKRAECGKD